MTSPSYSVALVQNQSEMAHYGYADARPLLEDYAVELVTGDNIGSLRGLLARQEVDALVLGSNALNDRGILDAVNCPEFAAALSDYLATGRGVLCLQQLGLAMRDGPTLVCLPKPLGKLLPVVPRDQESQPSAAGFAFGAHAARHVTLTYPHRIETEAVRAHALGFSSLPGLYWHYLADADLADWDQLLVDRATHMPRSLLLAAKESAHRRVVVSALPLDWQRHEELFANLLVYVTEGRHHLATVHAAGVLVEDDEYLQASLRAQRLAFGDYALPADAERAAGNIELGIHSTLLLSPSLGIERLPEPLRGAVATGISTGRLRVVDIGEGAFGTRSMSVISRELRPMRLLAETELQIQAELRSGYIDDSFWSHVETLQTLEALALARSEARDRPIDYAHVQDEAFAIVRNHERRGSYDEIFGPTCALYWLRAQYRGADSDEALASAAWLRERLPRHAPDERALAYLTFARIGRLTSEERADLERSVAALGPGNATESQTVLYLRACVVARLPAASIAVLAEALLAAQGEDGTWIDLTTTATATSALLTARAELASAGEDHDTLIAAIESSALAAVVYMLRRLSRSEAVRDRHPYPWDGKASTTVKCLQAWLGFDKLQDLPVFDILESLRRADAAAQRSASNRTALGVLQETSEENARLRRREATTSEQLGATQENLDRARTALTWWRLGAGVAALATYIAVALLVGALNAKRGGLSKAFDEGISGAWEIHSVVAIPFALALGRYGYNRWRERHPAPPE